MKEKQKLKKLKIWTLKKNAWSAFVAVFAFSLNNFKHVCPNLHRLIPYSAKMATSQTNNTGRTSALRLYFEEKKIAFEN